MTVRMRDVKHSLNRILSLMNNSGGHIAIIKPITEQGEIVLP